MTRIDKAAIWIAMHPWRLFLNAMLATALAISVHASYTYSMVLPRGEWFCLAKMRGACVTWAHVQLLTPHMEAPQFELQPQAVPDAPAVIGMHLHKTT